MKKPITGFKVAIISDPIESQKLIELARSSNQHDLFHFDNFSRIDISIQVVKYL